MGDGILSRGLGLARLGQQARKLSQASDEVSRRNARRHLTRTMGRLRGMPQKLGQILSMSAENGEEFEPLTDAAEALPFGDLVPTLERCWGRPVDEVLRSVDEVGLAASLGQVHQAELHDGRVVAVKVRIPGIAKALRNDIRMLGGLSYLVGDLRRGFDLSSYRHSLFASLTEELDYRQEAGRQVALDKALSGPHWVVPEVVEELSGEEVLVSCWEDGDRLAEAEQWPEADRKTLARTLLQGFLSGLFDSGLVHADPHHGNYRFRRGPDGPQVVLYDYGSVFRPSREQQAALARLIDLASTREGDPLPAYLQLGFDRDLLDPMAAKLLALTSILFEPFATQAPFAMGRWRLGERVEDLLGEDRWNFRMSGPPELLLLMRAFHGLLHYQERLDVPVNWAFFAKPLLERWAAPVAELATRRLPDAGPRPTLARSLCIHVTEAGRTKAKVTLPATAVEDLETVMGEELVQQVQERGIELRSILRQAREAAYAPQDLFVLEEGERSIRVWLGD